MNSDPYFFGARPLSRSPRLAEKLRPSAGWYVGGAGSSASSPRWPLDSSVPRSSMGASRSRGDTFSARDDPRISSLGDSGSSCVAAL